MDNCKKKKKKKEEEEEKRKNAWTEKVKEHNNTIIDKVSYPD
jgi:hypothetical protein